MFQRLKRLFSGRWQFQFYRQDGKPVNGPSYLELIETNAELGQLNVELQIRETELEARVADLEENISATIESASELGAIIKHLADRLNVAETGIKTARARLTVTLKTVIDGESLDTGSRLDAPPSSLLSQSESILRAIGASRANYPAAMPNVELKPEIAIYGLAAEALYLQAKRQHANHEGEQQ